VAKVCVWKSAADCCSSSRKSLSSLYGSEFSHVTKVDLSRDGGGWRGEHEDEDDEDEDDEEDDEDGDDDDELDEEDDDDDDDGDDDDDEGDDEDDGDDGGSSSQANLLNERFAKPVQAVSLNGRPTLFRKT
jgi:hypothetical protein